MPIELVVGLGNPGDRYAGTRHNAGADFVTELASRHGVRLAEEARFFGRCGRLQVAGRDVRLLVPTTFMNRSGQSVAALCNYFKIPLTQVLVAHDELDFEPGIARLKKGGGHGGHNGLRDISKALGDDFLRLRLGIGHPGLASEVSNYVLSRPCAADRLRIDTGIDEAVRVFPLLAQDEWARATQQLHTATKATEDSQDGI